MIRPSRRDLLNTLAVAGFVATRPPAVRSGYDDTWQQRLARYSQRFRDTKRGLQRSAVRHHQKRRSLAVCPDHRSRRGGPDGPAHHSDRQ